jgi:hypothetical protein
MKLYMEQRKAGADTVVVYDEPEQQSKLNPYEDKESFNDYSEMVIQYGFITLFVVGFPLTPLLAFINNVAEVHVDAIKMTIGHRRPNPRSVENIGSWNDFLAIMSTVSVMTNVALVFFTQEYTNQISCNTGQSPPDLAEAAITCADYERVCETDETSPQFGLCMEKTIMPQSLAIKWVAFLACEHILLLIKAAVQEIVPDMPEDCETIDSRFDYMTKRTFDDLKEDDDSGLEEKAEDNIDLSINESSAGVSTAVSNPIVVQDRAQSSV